MTEEQPIKVSIVSQVANLGDGYFVMRRDGGIDCGEIWYAGAPILRFAPQLLAIYEAALMRRRLTSVENLAP